MSPIFVFFFFWFLAPKTFLVFYFFSLFERFLFLEREKEDMAEKEAKKRKRNTLTPPIKSSPPPPSSPCSPPPPSSPSSLSSSPSSLSSSPSMWKCDICNFTCKLKARTQHIRGPGHQHKTFLAGQSCVCSSPFTSRLKPNLVGTNPSKKTEEPPQSEFNDMFCADCGFAFFLNRREFNALHAFPFYLDQCLSRSDIAPDQMKLILQQVLETISACSRKFSFHDPHGFFFSIIYFFKTRMTHPHLSFSLRYFANYIV